MQFPQSLDLTAINGVLSSKWGLDRDIIIAYGIEGQLGLLEEVKKILDTKKSCQKRARAKDVLLKLESIIPMEEREALETLDFRKRTNVTRAIWKILFPVPKKRFKIESMREKVVRDLRNKCEPEQEAVQILSELYYLLSLGSTKLQSLFLAPLDGHVCQEIKKCLTSLKKMMGCEVGMEETEKQEKKKAYQQNICIRKLLQSIGEHIDEPEIRVKLSKMMRAPKNKKWFGKRLNKLLLSEKWLDSEMKILASHIKSSMVEKEIGGIKMKNYRGQLNEIYQNIMSSCRGDLEVLTSGTLCREDLEVKNSTLLMSEIESLPLDLKSRELDNNFSLFDSLLQ